MEFFIIYLFTFLSLTTLLFVYAYSIYKEKKLRERITSLVNRSQMFTPEELFELRARRSNRSLVINDYNSPGVYVLLNLDKDMYYVGQGKKVFDRVNAHFSGRGNGDVYADYKYGDDFGIRILDLYNSGYDSLNELERHTIRAYNAYGRGYNRNRGIRN